MNLSFDGLTHNTSGNLARCSYFFLAYLGFGKITSHLEWDVFFFFRGYGNESCNLMGSWRGPYFPISVHGHGNAHVSCRVICTVAIFTLTKGWRSKRQLFNSLRWPIYIITSVDNTKLPCYTLSPTQQQFHWKLTPFIQVKNDEVSILECRSSVHHTRNYTRASCGLVDITPRKQRLCNPRFERKIILIKL